MHPRLRIAVCTLLFALVLSLPATAAVNKLTEEELDDGWISLFDGKTLYGWKAATKADWKVSGSTITVTSGEQGLLCTTTSFADYVLKLDFLAGEQTNSGIFLRTKSEGGDVATDSYELNIAPPDNPFPTGSFVSRKKSDVIAISGIWQTYEVTCQGDHFLVKLDGKIMLDYTDKKPVGRGLIGLQVNSGKVQFRNIKLKPLGLESIFNGKDLGGWNLEQTRKSVFSVTPEGAIHVKNGPGQLESEGQWADLVMQLEIISHGKELNSGIFFRSVPGDYWLGYESQIHNGTIDGDRTKPSNSGTGSIFNRQAARRVVSDDFKWFHKTIIADSAHMAVWVEGVQVSDWTDTREPSINPREGLRLEKGTVLLQGHDPTTDLSFRNLRIAEIPPR